MGRGAARSFAHAHALRPCLVHDAVGRTRGSTDPPAIGGRIVNASTAVAAMGPGSERRQDWGDAPDVLGFVGRLDELALVRDWVLGSTVEW